MKHSSSLLFGFTLTIATISLGCVEAPKSVSSPLTSDTKEMGVKLDMTNPVEMGKGVDMFPVEEFDMGPDAFMPDLAPSCPDRCPEACLSPTLCVGECSGDEGCLENQEGNKVCDVGNKTCVVCLEDSNEAIDKGCNAENPVCVGGVCAPCSEDCEAKGLKCDVAKNACVECLSDATCTEAGKPLCLGGTCGPCEDTRDDAKCAAKSSDPLVCVSGSCVACRGDEQCKGQGLGGEDVICKTNVCTDLEVGATEVGFTCEFDRQCKGNAACVPLKFGGGVMDAGSFCLEVKPQGACQAPWGQPVTRESESESTPRAFCGIVENFTTPTAVLSLQEGKGCLDEKECGQGGLCVDLYLDGTKECTYKCTQDFQCPNFCRVSSPRVCE